MSETHHVPVADVQFQLLPALGLLVFGIVVALLMGYLFSEPNPPFARLVAKLFPADNAFRDCERDHDRGDDELPSCAASDSPQSTGRPQRCKDQGRKPKHPGRRLFMGPLWFAFSLACISGTGRTQSKDDAH